MVIRLNTESFSFVKFFPSWEIVIQIRVGMGTLLLLAIVLYQHC